MAVICNDQKFVDSLCNKGISVDCTNVWGRNKHKAKLSFNAFFLKILSLFCEKIFSDSSTLLGTASCFGTVEMFEWLLNEKKADISVVNKKNGHNVLHNSIFFGNERVMDYILKKNLIDIQVPVKNKRKSSCLDMAILGGNFNIYKKVTQLILFIFFIL